MIKTSVSTLTTSNDHIIHIMNVFVAPYSCSCHCILFCGLRPTSTKSNFPSATPKNSTLVRYSIDSLSFSCYKSIVLFSCAQLLRTQTVSYNMASYIHITSHNDCFRVCFVYLFVFVRFFFMMFSLSAFHVHSEEKRLPSVMDHHISALIGNTLIVEIFDFRGYVVDVTIGIIDTDLD